MVSPAPQAAPPPPQGAQPAPQSAPYPFPSLVEDEDVAPTVARPAAPLPTPQVVAPAAPLPAPSTEAVGEVQLLLSPIASFPRLAELQRRLQRLAGLRAPFPPPFPR